MKKLPFFLLDLFVLVYLFRITFPGSPLKFLKIH